MQINSVTPKRGFWLIMMIGIIILIFQSCVTTSYNNRYWQRIPPSTGHNRCGCMIQKYYEFTPKNDRKVFRA